MFFVDSHCHLDQLNYYDLHKGLSDVLDKAKICNVGLILSVSISLENFSNMVKFVGCRDDVLFSCGVHPLYLNIPCYSASNLFHLSSYENVVALGETGLDYHYFDSNKQQQRQVFQDHLDIAYRKKKPVIIHSRSAYDDTIAILRENKFNVSGVFHCFTGDMNIAKVLLDLGFYISFSGILTFENSQYLKIIANYIPLDRILLETDAPYLAPVPYRGTENQPAYLYETAKSLSEVKGISLHELSVITTNNFLKLFQIIDNKKYSVLVNKIIVVIFMIIMNFTIHVIFTSYSLSM